MYFENFDLKNTYTPVNADKLEQLLIQTQYPKDKTHKLVDGFKNGFDLGYRGKTKVKLTSANLKLTIGNKTELWNKVMKRVQLKRYAGPFRTIPFKYYIQSPIGLVPKDGGTKTRLIFHLSYPKEGTTSVNANTPEELTSVSYPDFDRAVQLCINEGKGCKAGKSDLSAAFRHLCMAKRWWKYLVMKAQSPLDQKTYYFVDKCLPFGSSISCAHFQEFLNALSHIIGGSRGGRARRAPPHLPGILVFIGGSREAHPARTPPFAWHPSF